MNLQAGFVDMLPDGATRARRPAARDRGGALLLLAGIFAAGQISERLSIDFPEPAGERSAA